MTESQAQWLQTREGGPFCRGASLIAGHHTTTKRSFESNAATLQCFGCMARRDPSMARLLNGELAPSQGLATRGVNVGKPETQIRPKHHLMIASVADVEYNKL